jgi:hypothetical protein
MTRNAVIIITAKSNLTKTIVIGWKVLFAILNQMNEKDQKIIDSITAPYVLTCLFKSVIRLTSCFRSCEFIAKNEIKGNNYDIF